MQMNAVRRHFLNCFRLWIITKEGSLRKLGEKKRALTISNNRRREGATSRRVSAKSIISKVSISKREREEFSGANCLAIALRLVKALGYDWGGSVCHHRNERSLTHLYLSTPPIFTDHLQEINHVEPEEKREVEGASSMEGRTTKKSGAQNTTL